MLDVTTDARTGAPAVMCRDLRRALLWASITLTAFACGRSGGGGGDGDDDAGPGDVAPEVEDGGGDGSGDGGGADLDGGKKPTKPAKPAKPTKPTNGGDDDDHDGGDDDASGGGGGNGGGGGGGGGGGTSDDDGRYDQAVEPTTASIQEHLIAPYCSGCHTGGHAAGGVDLSDLAALAEAAIAGLDREELIVAGAPEASRLYKVMTTAVDAELMPPVKSKRPRVHTHQAKALHDWIKELRAPTPTDPDTPDVPDAPDVPDVPKVPDDGAGDGGSGGSDDGAGDDRGDDGGGDDDVRDGGLVPG